MFEGCHYDWEGNAFLEKEFGNKAQQAFDRLERMKTRQYTPRKLTNLFA